MNRFSLISLAPLLFFSACIVSDVRIPGPIVSDARFGFSSDDFKVVGTVEAEGEIKSILGLVQWGGNGYSELYDKAKKMGGDELMNYVFEIQGYSILSFVYNKATWKARATVVQFTDRVKK